MLSEGRLVLKLPRQKVDELVASGVAERFDPGHGRTMKEWVTIGSGESRRWTSLAEEARQFVAATAGTPRRR
jgi:predicted ArsR family transcriptional regulator